MQIVLPQREQRLIALLRCQIGPRNDILMNSNGSIDLSAPPKQTTKGKVSFYRFVINPDHLEKMLKCLVRLLVKKEVEALEIIHINRRRRVFFIVLAEASQRPSCRGKQQK